MSPRSAGTKLAQRPHHLRTEALRTVLALFLLGVVLWCAYLYYAISAVGSQDEAIRSDAIAVFGAAEYHGRPSPVFHARLDHALDLYRKGIAPIIITLGGGSDSNSGQTEGGVGRDYLLANGVPIADLIAETRSIDTEQQVRYLAAIAHEHDLHAIVVVSDPTHLFRIRALCMDAGLDVYTSPRPPFGRVSTGTLFRRYAHEMLSYTSFRLGLQASALHRWIEGKGDD